MFWKGRATVRSISILFLLLSFFLSANAEQCFAVTNAPAPTGAAPTSQTSASTRKTMIVAKSAIFGLGGGLVVGLASQVFKKNTKNIFLAGSLGMYAGIGLGIYIISSTHAARYDGPDTYKDLDDFQNGSLNQPEKVNTIGIKDPKEPLKVALFSTNF